LPPHVDTASNNAAYPASATSRAEHPDRRPRQRHRRGPADRADRRLFLRRSRPGAGRVGCASWRAGRWWAAVPGVSRVLLLLAEDGCDLGRGTAVADVAGEDDAGHADGLGAASPGPSSEMTLGNSWPATSACRMPGRCTGDVVGGDRAVGGAPGGLGGQRLPGGVGQGGADRAVMARLPVAPRTRRGWRAAGQRAACSTATSASRDRAAWSRCGSAAAYGAVRRQRPGHAARAAGPAQPGCGYWPAREQTGAASNAAVLRPAAAGATA
jgi:hypothetical protein